MISPRAVATLGIQGVPRQSAMLGIFIVEAVTPQEIFRESIRLMSPLTKLVSLISKVQL